MTSALSVINVTKSFKRPLDRSATMKYRVTHPRSSSRYEMFHALRDVSFEVPEGQFLGIIGANGCGKSTLLKILSRIYQADQGTVDINGKVSPFLELGVGFNPELSARENVFLSGAVLGLTRAELRDRVDGIIAFAELTEFSDMKLKNFSSGMQVRLAFSVSIQAEADILLMDEVLAVGDASFVEKCFDVFARHKREGRTIVLVTHDLSSISLHCDRALLLDHGALVADGTPSEVVSAYRRIVDGISNADESHLASSAPKRSGSREIEVTGVRILDSSGTPRHTFSTGSPVQLEVGFKVNTQVGDFSCAIPVDRNDGLPLACPLYWKDEKTIPCPPAGSTGTIVYRIHALALLSGSYVVSVVLLDLHGNHDYDRLERSASFRVSAASSGLACLVDLEGEWAVTVAEPEPVDVASGVEPARRRA